MNSLQIENMDFCYKRYYVQERIFSLNKALLKSVMKEVFPMV